MLKSNSNKIILCWGGGQPLMLVIPIEMSETTPKKKDIKTGGSWIKTFLCGLMSPYEYSMNSSQL